VVEAVGGAWANAGATKSNARRATFMGSPFQAHLNECLLV
jgi:hypothetical protein